VLRRSETVTEALERSGFNEIQDVLLMNQAERDMLTFLNADGVITPLPVGPKSVLHCLRLFSCYYCEDNGEPIIYRLQARPKNWFQLNFKDIQLSINMYFYNV